MNIRPVHTTAYPQAAASVLGPEGGGLNARSRPAGRAVWAVACCPAASKPSNMVAATRDMLRVSVVALEFFLPSFVRTIARRGRKRPHKVM